MYLLARYTTLCYDINIIPGVKRDSNNHRVFNDQGVAWINSLGSLKRCSMNIQEMKEYVALCIEGESSISKRKESWHKSERTWSLPWQTCKKH